MLTRTMKIIYVFYTFRGLIFHMLYFLGYLPNTWIIALFIRIVSQVFLFIWPNYLKMYGFSWNTFFREIVFHRVPLYLVPIGLSRASVGLFLGSLAVYLRAHGPKKVIALYSNKKKVVKEWFEEVGESISQSVK